MQKDPPFINCYKILKEKQNNLSQYKILSSKKILNKKK
jgi:hypothetical protein